MTASTTFELLRDLRPQAYGTASPGRIPNPVIEPMWSGIRVLAAVEADESQLIDHLGEPVDDQPLVEAALRSSIHAEALVIDGVLTKQVAHGGTGAFIGADLPSTGSLIARSMVGTRRNRTAERTEELERDRAARTFGPDDIVVLVATDLLHLDGESLLDVPLLERKRLLESVFDESDRLRRGAYIRPPIDTWVNSWRSLGFQGLTYKAANGRYRPGVWKDDWATSPMPRR